jgi:hypothetical protein
MIVRQVKIVEVGSLEGEYDAMMNTSKVGKV